MFLANSYKITARRRGSRHTVTPIAKELLALDCFRTRKINQFFSGVTWYIAHILRQAPFTGVVGQHKQYYIFLRKREVRDGGLRENLIRGGGYNKMYKILKEWMRILFEYYLLFSWQVVKHIIWAPYWVLNKNRF